MFAERFVNIWTKQEHRVGRLSTPPFARKRESEHAGTATAPPTEVLGGNICGLPYRSNRGPHWTSDDENRFPI